VLRCCAAIVIAAVLVIVEVAEKEDRERSSCNYLMNPAYICEFHRGMFVCGPPAQTEHHYRHEAPNGAVGLRPSERQILVVIATSTCLSASSHSVPKRF